MNLQDTFSRLKTLLNISQHKRLMQRGTALPSAVRTLAQGAHFHG